MTSFRLAPVDALQAYDPRVNKPLARKSPSSVMYMGLWVFWGHKRPFDGISKQKVAHDEPVSKQRFCVNLAQFEENRLQADSHTYTETQPEEFYI